MSGEIEADGSNLTRPCSVESPVSAEGRSLTSRFKNKFRSRDLRQEQWRVLKLEKQKPKLRLRELLTLKEEQKRLASLKDEIVQMRLSKQHGQEEEADAKKQSALLPPAVWQRRELELEKEITSDIEEDPRGLITVEESERYGSEALDHEKELRRTRMETRIRQIRKLAPWEESRVNHQRVPQKGALTADKLRTLCRLMILRYGLDDEIWRLSHVHPPLRHPVQKRMVLADRILNEIYGFVSSWDNPNQWETRDEYDLFVAVKERLRSDDMRVWHNNSPWGQTNNDFPVTNRYNEPASSVFHDRSKGAASSPLHVALTGTNKSATNQMSQRKSMEREVSQVRSPRAQPVDPQIPNDAAICSKAAKIDPSGSRAEHFLDINPSHGEPDSNKPLPSSVSTSARLDLEQEHVVRNEEPSSLVNTVVENGLSEDTRRLMADPKVINALPAASARGWHAALDALDGDFFQDLVVYESYKPSFVEWLQSLIEDYTRTRWLWWPLFEPSYPLLDGFIYIEWKCDCGSQQRVQVPREFIRRLEKLRQGPTLQVAATGSSSSQSTTSGSSGSPIANLSSSQTSLSSGAQSSKSLKIPDPSPAGQQVSTVKTPSLRRTNNAFGTLFVFLVARVGDYYKLCQLEVQGKNDDEFFSDLKRQYFKARALLRTWLSIWKYAHCDFYLFKKIEHSEIVAIVEKMPEPDNPDYIFAPYEISPSRPITKSEFRLRFYECYRGGMRRHRHHFRNCRKLPRPKRDSLDKIPKRKLDVVENSDESDIFYGLLAVEEPAFWMVAAYQIMFMAGPFVFWGVWLSVMKHPADLQDASVPFLVALGLMSTFWFPFLHSSRPPLL